MGIKLAKPDSDVFCITGEGSVQMCIQELSTCLQYNTPIKVLSLNNRYWAWYGSGSKLNTRVVAAKATWTPCPIL